MTGNEAAGVTGHEAVGAKSQRAAGPGSPIGRLGGTVGRLPRYLRLARELLQDPKLSRWRKAGLAASLAYVASPIDLVPGLIPIAGQLDDLAALLLGLRMALRGCTTETARAHLAAASLQPGDLDRDLVIVHAAAGWIAGRIGRASIKIGRTAVKAAGRLMGMGARGAGSIVAGIAKRR